MISCPLCNNRGCEGCNPRREAELQITHAVARDFLNAERKRGRLTKLHIALLEAGILQNIVRAAIDYGRELTEKKPVVSEVNDSVFSVRLPDFGSGRASVMDMAGGDTEEAERHRFDHLLDELVQHPHG